MANKKIKPFRKATVVGSRVQIAVRSSGTDSAVMCAGVVVEDYADMVIDRDLVGRDWAPVQRWAIALDDGRLVFADDGDLKGAGPARNGSGA